MIVHQSVYKDLEQNLILRQLEYEKILLQTDVTHSIINGFKIYYRTIFGKEDIFQIAT